MKKSFILITRSYKHGGYCVAGFDAETKKWIRLVSSVDPSQNEIPKGIFDGFGDLDILEIETLGGIPFGCQIENFLLDLNVPPVRRGRLAFFELFAAPYLSSAFNILGNPLSALTEEEMQRQRGSLGLFQVDSLRFDYYNGDDDKLHYRSEFLYRGTAYSGISVTDPVYRRDEFAGQTIEHALLVVSLPAVPYPNGKYYKFIAKIFPLAAGEAGCTERTAVSAPHPRNFSQNFPDASEESTARAAVFLQALSEGRDPETGEGLDPARILSPSYAAWLRYCATLVGKAEKSAGARSEKGLVYLRRERIGEISISDEPITASKLCERVNAVREPYGKKLTAVSVGAFFVEAGMLASDEGQKQKFPTDLGNAYGIDTEMRSSAGGAQYSVVLYGRAAQQYLLDNIEIFVTVIDVPSSVPPASPDRGEAQRTRSEEWKKPSAAPTDRSWERWDRNEQDALVREYASRLRLEEIAKRHRRSVAAIAARLKMLGFEVNDER